ncbi:MAG: Mov34/MPN/PAD-1 family protein [Candidatus Hodarchaeales archaeon]
MNEVFVVISKSTFRKIILLLTKKSENERVGLGFGVHEESRIELRDFVPMTNMDHSPASFSIDYEVLIKEIHVHEKKGEILIGIFHSHPEGSSLYPSLKDLHFMRYWPFPYLWLIGGGTPVSKLEIFSLYKKKIVKVPYSVSEE